MRLLWIFFALLVAAMIWAVALKSVPTKVEQIKVKVSSEDYQRLLSLEKEFCDVCNTQTTEEWQNSRSLAKIVEERNAILDKKELRKMQFPLVPRTAFNWQCHYDDDGVFSSKCEQ